MTWEYPPRCSMSPPVIRRASQDDRDSAAELGFIVSAWPRMPRGLQTYILQNVSTALVLTGERFVPPDEQPASESTDVEPRKPMGFLMPEKNEKQFSAENV